jgi:UDP-glucose 4-epimerase
MLAEIMAIEEIDAVIHLTAREQIAGSVACPLWYCHQNRGGLSAMLWAVVTADSALPLFFVFSRKTRQRQRTRWRSTDYAPC